MTSDVNQTELERVLINFEDTLEYRRKVLSTLVNGKVYVVLDKPWDRQRAPDPDTHFLLVSDGENSKQPMLALFTSTDKLAAVPTEGTGFQHPVEVDARWALLGVPPSAGIRINPNAVPGFRIDANLSAQLRGAVERTLPQGPPPAASSS